MLQISAYKLHDIQAHCAPTVGSGFFVFEADTAVFNVNDSIVGYGDLEDIRSQVLDALLTVTDGLAVHNEVFSPDL